MIGLRMAEAAVLVFAVTTSVVALAAAFAKSRRRRLAARAVLEVLMRWARRR